MRHSFCPVCGTEVTKGPHMRPGVRSYICINSHWGPWGERVKKPIETIIAERVTMRVWLLRIVGKVYRAVGRAFSLQRLSGASLWK